MGGRDVEDSYLHPWTANETRYGGDFYGGDIWGETHMGEHFR